jgi:hypothetical protein
MRLSVTAREEELNQSIASWFRSSRGPVAERVLKVNGGQFRSFNACSESAGNCERAAERPQRSTLSPNAR